MDLLISILQMIFDMFRRVDVPIVRQMLILYLVISAMLLFIGLVKGVKR